MPSPARSGATDKPTVTAKATQAGPSDDRPIQSIVALVNDEPITGYEIEQRVALAMLGAPDVQKQLQAKLKSPNMNEQFKAFAMKRLKANPPKTEDEQQARVKQLQGEFVASIKNQIEKEYAPTARKQALDEIIDERLKMQEAKRLSIVAADDEVERIISGMAERNKMTVAAVRRAIGKMGASIVAMRERIRASLSWTRRHPPQVRPRRSPSPTATSTAWSPAPRARTTSSCSIHRILLSVPPARIRSGSPSASTTPSSCAASSRAARPWRRWRAAFPAPASTTSATAARAACPSRRAACCSTRTTTSCCPPTIGENGVELWAVCGRKLVKAAETSARRPRTSCARRSSRSSPRSI